MSFLLLLFPALFGLLLWDAAQDNDDSPSDSEDEITGQGNDTVEGAGTDDLIRGYDGDDSLTGGDGDDTLSGGEGFDIVLGGAGNDVVKGGDEFDLLGGGAGDDSVFGNDGDDFLDDEVGTDYLDGGNGDDIIVAFDNSPGAGGPDTLVGGRGNDILWGDDGDFLIGGAGGDEFEVIAGQEGAEPVVIRDFGLAHSGDEETRDRVNFVDLDGHFLSVAELAERGLSAFDREDGTGTDILLDGEAIVVIEGHSASALTSRTSWIGNFSAGNSARYDDAQELTGTSRDDDIEGGGGDDTIFGGGGIDFLDGGTGDDLLLGDDAAGAGGAGDLLLGGEGDDTLRGDEGDFLTGEEGRDSFEIVVPFDAGSTPLEIYGYQLEDGEDGVRESVTLVDEIGEPLSADDVIAGLTVIASDDGDAMLQFEGQSIALLIDIDPSLLDTQEEWLGNLAGAGVTMVAPPPAGEVAAAPDEVAADAPVDYIEEASVQLAAVESNLRLTEWTPTGEIVTPALFGANAVYSINTESGLPSPSFMHAIEELDIKHLRYPGGQGDDTAVDVEGQEWLNIVTMVEVDGEYQLRPELVRMLEWARNPEFDSDGNGIKLTLVIPTKHLDLDEYGEFGAEIERFAEHVVRDFGDVVEAFEIGNEYWGMGETEYSAKANLAAPALANGIAAAGVTSDEGPSIIVQMATPNAGSEFHRSVDSRGFTTRLVDANQRIIDGLGEEARDAIDGVVEHYYYRSHNLAFTDENSEKDYINRDYAVWDDNFDKDLDLHVTEWNVRTSNIEENGLRSASVILEQFENMLEMGTDAGSVWPIQHNTTSDLAGPRGEAPLLDDSGRVLNTIRGAIFDRMSSSLPGMELIETTFAGDDGSSEINAYQSEEKTVIYVSSRSLDTLELDLDLTALVGDFESAAGVRISVDRSPESSDGWHWVPHEGHARADFSVIDGQRFFYNEHDVHAELTDVEIDRAALTLNLKPFEVVELTFLTVSSPIGGVGEPTETTQPGRSVIGAESDDDLRGSDGNDTMHGLEGADKLNGGNGADSISGDGGDDNLKGGRGDDMLFGDSGNDSLYGWGGGDYLKGNEGNDVVVGNQGNDTLIGSAGDDSIRGGDGNDSLNGGRGTDRITGEQGADIATGWAGDDIFSFEDGHIADGDTITDFQPGRDVLELNLSGIDSVSDITFRELGRGQGVALDFRGHGRLILQGDLRIDQLRDPANFSFVS